MLHSVEGIANLNLLHAFLNKEKINSSIDVKKKIDYEISNSKSPINCDGHAKRVYGEILELLGNKSTVVSVAPAVSVPIISTAVPVATNLASTYGYTPTPEKQTAPQQTPYETESYNKILYGTGTSAYDEDMEQERLNMIESIDELRSELSTMDGVNIKTIPHVDRNSNIHDIKSVYKLLLQKKNMSMYFETAKDVILIGINKLVNFCDGRPGRPNLTGWERTANFKLNSLKTEMANMVGGFFKNYNIPPILQILFSLVPSAFLHASLRERQSGLKASNDSALNDLRKMMD